MTTVYAKHHGIALNTAETRALNRLDASKNGLAPTAAMTALVRYGLATRIKQTRVSGRGGMPSSYTVEKIAITDAGCAWIRAFNAAEAITFQENVTAPSRDALIGTVIERARDVVQARGLNCTCGGGCCVCELKKAIEALDNAKKGA